MIQVDTVLWNDVESRLRDCVGAGGRVVIPPPFPEWNILSFIAYSMPEDVLKELL